MSAELSYRYGNLVGIKIRCWYSQTPAAPTIAISTKTGPDQIASRSTKSLFS